MRQRAISTIICNIYFQEKRRANRTKNMTARQSPQQICSKCIKSAYLFTKHVPPDNSEQPFLNYPPHQTTRPTPRPTQSPLPYTPSLPLTYEGVGNGDLEPHPVPHLQAAVGRGHGARHRQHAGVDRQRLGGGPWRQQRHCTRRGGTTRQRTTAGRSGTAGVSGATAPTAQAVRGCGV